MFYNFLIFCVSSHTETREFVLDIMYHFTCDESKKNATNFCSYCRNINFRKNVINSAF